MKKIDSGEEQHSLSGIKKTSMCLVFITIGIKYTSYILQFLSASILNAKILMNESISKSLLDTFTKNIGGHVVILLICIYMVYRALFRTKDNDFLS